MSAWLLLLPASAQPWDLIPGNPEAPDLQATVQYHWLTHERGPLGVSHSRMQMFPLTIDRLVLSGVPMDGMASWPFVKLLGWPAGFTVFWIVVLWGLGLTHAWLAGCWWRSPVAALVGGVLAQSAAPLLRELCFGRPTQLFAAMFVPLALGWFARSLSSGSRREGLLAGLSLALCALSYWYFGFFCALAMLVLWVLALLDRRPVRAVTLYATAGAVLPTFLPAAYTFAALEQQAGMDAGMWTLVRRGGWQMYLWELLEEEDLWAQLPESVVGFLPILLCLLLIGVFRQRFGQRLAPTVWLVSGVALAMGPWLYASGDFRIPGPWALLTMVPVLRRLWWPDRAMLLAVPGLVILGAGGAVWVWQRLQKRRPFVGRRRGAIAYSLGLAVCLLFEATLALITLPMPATWGSTSPYSEVLSRGSGPMLILPQAVGPFLRGRRILLDQNHHGRPLVNGMMPPDSSTAPRLYQKISETPSLAHLYQCVWSPEAVYAGDGEEGLETLRKLGVKTVYVDDSAFPYGKADPLYLSCVAGVLGEPAEVEWPFRVYPL